MDMKLVCLCVVVLSLELVCCTYSNSPCPGVFDFESDGSDVYGKIILRPVAPVSSLIIRINFTVAAQLYNNYVGRIEPIGSNLFLQRYNRGQPVSYRVFFPVTSPLPKLTAMTVNGDTICYGPGDSPRPNTYVTTLSLQHTSYLQGGAAPVYNNFQHQQQHHPRPDPVLELVTNFGDDGAAQIYTFNNIEPTWSTGNSPYYVVNNSRPFSQSTQPVYQPPTQQVYPQSSRPVYEQSRPFEIATLKPIYRPNRPIFEQGTKRPIYEPPVTQPQSRPNPDDNLYYPEVTSTTTTPKPSPMVTARPESPQPDNPTAANECGIVAGGNERIPLIYNGKSYERGDVPWLVAIYKNSGGSLSFICGGTLVSNRHVVTAAHCMQRRSELASIKDFVVKVGVHNLNDWSSEITVTRTLISAAIHEAFNPATLENDLMVLTFNKRVTFNTYIRPACLWNGNIELSNIVGAYGAVAGWGEQSATGSGLQGEPHMVHIPIVSTAVCRASKAHFHKLTSQTTLCAGDRNGSGPCRGDSGGGLYLLDDGKWRLRGVVSVSLRAENGDNTCNLNEYIIFTDTAQFLTWIRSVISENYYD